MPVRKIPKNYRNVTGVAAAGKAVGPAQFESTLERDFLALLEFSPEVEQFEVQPIVIKWYNEQGAPRSYTPDVLVKFNTETNRAPWLCEVKYRADIGKNWDDLHPKFRKGIRHAKQKGWRFRLITEVEVRTPYLDNVRFLMPFRFRAVPEDDSERLLDRLRSSSGMTPAAMIEFMSPDRQKQAELLPVLWRLIADHRVGVDLDVALTKDSPLWSLS
ncbi:MAG TPA: TnsA endonuclease N-terminal domain-containing protein [Burkholderiaceae bacterium]|nr:TnsA endonuclease N-terminal domain-containing protein [Burkholderiaceae bacterium]